MRCPWCMTYICCDKILQFATPAGYFADPTGALPSGVSSAEAHGTPSTPFAAAGTPSGAPSDGRTEAGGKFLHVSDSTGMCADASAVQASGSGGSGPQVAFSRSAQHSTLLQCMVSELVRSSHTVAASVSWRATLEGGRGLAGCFVHPILHGTGTAPAAAAALATGLPSARARHVPGERGAGGGKDATAGEAAVGRPSDGGAEGVGMGADVSQALLLALLDVRQWATLAVSGPSAGPSRSPSQAQSAAAADGIPVTAPSLPPLPPAPKPAPSAPTHSAFAGAARVPGSSPSPDPRAPPTDPRDVVLELADEDEFPDATLPSTDPRSAPSPNPLGPGSPSLAFRSRAASAGLLLNAGGGDGASGTRTPTTPGARLLSPCPSDMAPRRTGSSATLPGSPGMTTTGRLSISALTDADPDGEQYPYPYPYPSGSASNALFRGSGTVGGAPGSASTSTGGGVHTGRHTVLLFNSGGPGPSGPPMSASMRQHLNPAFGLHSPTPSNLSEFCWDDQASELPSPLSARATPNRQSRLSNPGALPSGAVAGCGGSDGVLLRPDDSSPDSTAPHGAVEDGVSGLRASSPAVGLDTGGSGEEVGAMLEGLRARTRPENGVVEVDRGGEAREGAGSGDREQQQQQGSVFSGAEAATTAAVAAAGGSVGDGSPDAIKEAVERWSSSGLAVAAYERRTPGGGVPLGPGDEMPTLSYMLDVSMLHTIRSAVQQAKSSGGEGGGDTGGSLDGYAGGGSGGGDGSLVAARQAVTSLGAQQQQQQQQYGDTMAAARQQGAAEVGIAAPTGAHEPVQQEDASLVHTGGSTGVTAGHVASVSQRQRASDSGGAGTGGESGSSGLHPSSRSSADGAASVCGRTPPLLRDSTSETASEVSLSPLAAAGHGSAAGRSATGSGMGGPMGLPPRQSHPHQYPQSSARSSHDGGGRSTSGRQDVWAAMAGGGSAGSGWSPGSPTMADAGSSSAHAPHAARDTHSHTNPHPDHPYYSRQHAGASHHNLTGASPGGAASPASPGSSVSFATLPLPTPAVTATSGGSSTMAPPALGTTPTSHPALGNTPPSGGASPPVHLFESPVSGLTAVPAPAPPAASTTQLPHAPALPWPHHDAHSPHATGRPRHASHSGELPWEQHVDGSTAAANGNTTASPRPPPGPHQHPSFRARQTGGASSLAQDPGTSHAPATRPLASPQDTNSDYTFAPPAHTEERQPHVASPTTPTAGPRSEPPGRIRSAPDHTPSPSASVARSSIHLADFLRTPTSSSTSPSPVRALYTPTTAVTPTARTSASHLGPAAAVAPPLGTSTTTAAPVGGGTSPAVRRIPRPPGSSTTTVASPPKRPPITAGAAPGMSPPHGGIPAGRGVKGGSHAVDAAYGQAASPPGKGHTFTGGGGHGGYAGRRSWEGGVSVTRGGDRRVSAEDGGQGGGQGGQSARGSRVGSREVSVDGVAGGGARGSRSGSVKQSPTAGRAVWH